MKKICLILVAAALAFSSCKGTYVMYNPSETPVIYFHDTLKTRLHSFSMIADDEISIDADVRIMGMPSEQDRTFKIEVIDTSASQFVIGNNVYPLSAGRPDIDFTVAEPVLPAGEVTMRLKITLKRQESMMNKYVRVGLRIVDNDDFHAVMYDAKSSNDVLTPEIYFYVNDGEPSCPSWWKWTASGAPGWNPYIGDFYPDKYRMLLKFFNETEVTSPVFHDNYVAAYGEFLENAEYMFWTKFYPSAWAKYVAVPLYEYYEQWYKDHPDDPNVELMDQVNLMTHQGWGDPRDGTYAILN